MEWKEKRERELEEIKRLPPDLIFQDLGIEPKQVGHRLCIFAPWREETKPSVFIEQKNGHYVWKDFGSGKGGSWIDFFMELYDWDYVETVKYLREKYLGADLDITTEINRANSFSFGSRKYELLKIEAKKVEHPALKNYLKARAIKKIPNWLREVQYQLLDKETGEVKNYFALGVETTTGSWILRNKFVKINLRTADNQEHSFAYIQNGKKRLVITEGLFDALSVEQFMSDFDIVILGGVGNSDKLFKSRICEQYDEIIVATDNDSAGDKFFNELFYYFVEKEKPVVLKRLVFGAKDLNEALVNAKELKLLNYTKALNEQINPPERDNNDPFSPDF